jgi:HNH endonuclease
MTHCPETRTAELLGKPLGSNNECSVAFSVRKVCSLFAQGWAQQKAGVPNSTTKYDLSGWEFSSVAPRFWAKVDQRGLDECWNWQASTTGTGLPYGQFTLPRGRDGKQPHVYAHRFAWILTHGPIPEGLQVCHKCDNPRCCNPTHFFLGTAAENLADCRAKGRMPSTRRRRPRVDFPLHASQSEAELTAPQRRIGAR